MNLKDEDEPKLARDWNISRVQGCLDSADKDSLHRFIDQRYRERFFEPIKKLAESPNQLQGYGFAIMALCSLLIESLQCYRYGLPTTYKPEYAKLLNAFKPTGVYEIRVDEFKNGAQAFEDFFSLDAHETLFPNVSGRVFYSAIRNGLLHQAQTKDGWMIRSGQPVLWNSGNRILDRTRFANALEKAFVNYVEQLRTAHWGDDVWLKARRKIWWLLQSSR